MGDQPPDVVVVDNDRPTGQEPATDQPTTDQAPVALEVAADQLGISVNAVRQRLKRGTLRGHKEAGAWVVFLPTDQPTMPSLGRQPTDQPPTAARPATNRPSDQADIAPLATLIADLSRENRELAAAAALWQERARLLGERLHALEAGQSVPAPPSSEAKEAPQDANAAPVRDDERDVASEPMRGAPESQGRQDEGLVRRWWRRITTR